MQRELDSFQMESWAKAQVRLLRLKLGQPLWPKLNRMSHREVCLEAYKLIRLSIKQRRIARSWGMSHSRIEQQYPLPNLLFFHTR